MKYLILILLVLSGFCVRAQKLESLYFNLYTDSLKKGTYNYINVDGKYSNGRYLPLTSKELSFSCADGKFEGNSLFLDTGFRKDSVTVKILLKSDTTVSKSRVIYIKKFESTEGLKTMEEVMKPKNRHSLSSGRGGERRGRFAGVGGLEPPRLVCNVEFSCLKLLFWRFRKTKILFKRFLLHRFFVFGIGGNKVMAGLISAGTWSEMRVWNFFFAFLKIANTVDTEVVILAEKFTNEIDDHRYTKWAGAYEKLATLLGQQLFDDPRSDDFAPMVIGQGHTIKDRQSGITQFGNL